MSVIKDALHTSCKEPGRVYVLVKRGFGVLGKNAQPETVKHKKSKGMRLHTLAFFKKGLLGFLIKWTSNV